MKERSRMERGQSDTEKKRPLVKICGITSVHDAEMALELGADLLGFILYPKSPRAVKVPQLVDLFKVVPEGKRVLVDVSTALDELNEYQTLPFDFYQMHFNLDISIAAVSAWSRAVGKERLWLAPRIPSNEIYFPQIVMEFGETILVDAYAKDAFGGTGKPSNWQRFMDWSVLYQHKRWALAGGLSPLNIEQALTETDPDIVDVNSGVESEPGVKDRAKLTALMAAIDARYPQER